MPDITNWVRAPNGRTACDTATAHVAEVDGQNATPEQAFDDSAGCCCGGAPARIA